jgi:hypothetical protein
MYGKINTIIMSLNWFIITSLVAVGIFIFRSVSRTRGWNMQITPFALILLCIMLVNRYLFKRNYPGLGFPAALTLDLCAIAAGALLILYFNDD